MYLERLLQINMATLTCLGSLLLGMGQRSPAMPLGVMVAAATAIWLTDVTGWFRLNRTVANVLALAAVLVSLRDTLSVRGEVQLLGIANLLVFLQVILLFQRKDDRIYWQLAILGLLQAVVATLFSQGVWFGLLLLVHLCVGMSALSLLCMFRQWRRHGPVAASSPPAAGPAGRWPLAGSQPAFSCTAGGSGRAGIVGEWFRRLGWMGLGTLGLTAVVFFIVPRFGRTAWRGAAIAPQQLVGFNDTVTLGELGEVLESRAEVMRVQFVEAATDRLYPVGEEVYLRGAILTRYDGGKWTFDSGVFGPDRAHWLPPAPAARELPPVVQRIIIEPLDRPELFCVWPVLPVPPNDDVRFDPRSQRLLRSERLCARRCTFELATTAFDRGVQVPLIPCQEPAVPDAWLQLPDLPRLRKLARQWIGESGRPPGDRIGRARYLEQKLRDSGQFQYSLEGEPRDPDIDAIEDFVSQHRRGHCEYFATALALMLRSQAIPSRVVVGYRCDEWNDLGKVFQVRQLHAHTWVEAYLEPHHLPATLSAGLRPAQWPAGGWLRLDATPAAAQRPAGGGSLLDRADEAAHWLQSLWANYVMEMDSQRQREAIYAPLARAVKGLFGRLGDRQWWAGWKDSVKGLLGRMAPGGSFLSWVVVLLAALVGLLAPVLCVWGLWRAARRVWRRVFLRSTAAGRGSRVEVEFYRRLETLLARQGLVRAAGETPREFASAAGRRIAAAAAEPRLEPLPREVVEAFYRVRFGGLPLDNRQAAAVEHALAQLAASV